MAFGVAVTSGGASSELTVTLTVFEVVVAGTLELSVTLSLKLHRPIAVDVVGEKVWSVPFAPAIGENVPPLKASSHW